MSLVATAPVDAFADEYTVSMKGKAFLPAAHRIQPDDTIRFAS
jgi:plastocyanin